MISDIYDNDVKNEVNEFKQNLYMQLMKVN